MLEFTVHGMPAPQGSKRYVGNGQMVEAAGDRLKVWRDAVRSDCVDALQGADPLQEGVFLGIVFYMPRPKNHFRSGKHAGELRDSAPYWHIKMPDIDKLLRSTLDGLKSGGLYADDCQVCRVVAEKRYVSGLGTPKAVIQVVPATIRAGES